MKIQKKIYFFFFGGGGGGRVGGSGWGVRLDVNEELKFLRKFKKKMGGGVRGVRLGGLGGCERKNEVFVNIQKTIGGLGGRGRVRVSGWM